MKKSPQLRALSELIDGMKRVERDKMQSFKKRSKKDLEDESIEDEEED